MSDWIPSGAEIIFLLVALAATIPLLLLVRWVLKELRQETARAKGSDDGTT